MRPMRAVLFDRGQQRVKFTDETVSVYCENLELTNYDNHLY